MRWAIYYGDGSRFSSEDGPPERAPPWNVAGVVQPSDRVGRIIVAPFQGKDYFVWREGEWYVCDFAGLMDSLAHFAGCVVRFGRTLPDDVWARVYQAMLDDPMFRPKSAVDRRREP